jgi:hypothetical protein
MFVQLEQFQLTNSSNKKGRLCDDFFYWISTLKTLNDIELKISI